MKICGIYKITSPSNKIYIGQSIDIFKRWQQYKYLIRDKRRTTRLKASFIKYSVDKHRFEVLCQCGASELNGLEKYYIKLYQTFNSKYGLNLEDGGNKKKKYQKKPSRKLVKHIWGSNTAKKQKRKLAKHCQDE